MTETTERLKANAQRMHEIADQQGTVSPGSQEKRVWVSSRELKDWAETNEDAAKSELSHEHRFRT